MKSSQPLQILLADDDAIDRELFLEALQSTHLDFKFSDVSGGNELLAHLEAGGRPHIIFLDLNMPQKDGRQTLRELKANKNYKSIPVIMFSTSNSYFDVKGSYEHGASLFLSKPDDFGKLTDMLHHIVTLSTDYVRFSD